MRGIILSAIVVLTAVFSAAALATGNNPVNSVYAQTGTKVQKVIGVAAVATPSTPQTTSAPATSSNAELPFTGLDLGLLCVAGVFLVGVGYSLRRVARKPPRPS